MKPQTCLVLIAVAMLAGCSSSDDDGRRPRSIPVAEQDLLPAIRIDGISPSGIPCALSTRRYTGAATGFWGAWTTPPFDVLWSIEFSDGDQQFELPSRYVRDLANVGNVVASSATPSVELMNSVSDRFTVEKSGSGYLVRLSGGDGASSYTATWWITGADSDSFRVQRRVDYKLHFPGGPWD